jgi:hypothetical protein
MFHAEKNPLILYKLVYFWAAFKINKNFELLKAKIYFMRGFEKLSKELIKVK